ncbi:hypothetical protein CPB84DRAFT_1749721 [Gymnopilus junonius]|uniref:Uncharacterized protein n=1 Tax=Gymnopilus junonius TaxID=109634 RepID=A0A9P5NFC4_GYMJU|nr:hypothetical protein CPB84DRAFT_1749721 [Gymnopilus junonius]
MLLPPPISSCLPSSEATTDRQQAFGIPPGLRDSVNMYSALAKPHPGLSALSGEPDGPVQQQQQTPKRKHSRDKGLSTTEEGGVLSNVGSFSEWEYQACDEEYLQTPASLLQDALDFCMKTYPSGPHSVCIRWAGRRMLGRTYQVASHLRRRQCKKRVIPHLDSERGRSKVD